MKKITNLIVFILTMGIVLTSCQKSENKETSKVTSQENNDLIDEEELSHDDLVKKAKEEKTLTIYGVHSYIEKAAKSFSEEYGIDVSWTQLGETELMDKVSTECKSNIDNGADLIFCQDGARIKAELVETNYLYKWKDKRLKELTRQKSDDMSLCIFEFSCKGFIYNGEADENQNSPYFTNIWMVTDPKYKGLFSLKDPTSEGVNFNFLTMLTKDDISQKMADAYKDYYGKDIQLTTDNAGFEFIKMMYENGVQLGTSDTKISEAVGIKGQDKKWIGYFSLQRLSTQQEKNLSLKLNKDAVPMAGGYYPIYSLILQNSKHKYASKLFIEYMLSKNGWQYFENNYGDYSNNPELSYAGDMSFDDWQKIAIGEDMDFVYKNRTIVEDFINNL